ncbi:MAG: DNA methylase [Bacteroidaceae bacterium]|nr:DNA methylase [Bacteroidaceae bacterium]
MKIRNRIYAAIDLKSFYASVECVERGLDPLNTNLVVADASRTDKTICLAVSPSLKTYGIGGRARLFEVVQRVRQINGERRRNAPGRKLGEPETDNRKVLSDPSAALGYITAPPQMAHYMEVSSRIYSIYLKYVAPEDIHVYSIDEVFIDLTDYLKMRKCTAHELTMLMIRNILSETGITATAGIGTNLYLAKVAMDIVAKHVEPDKDGVRIAELDEMSYRQQLWEHRPLTDFWRVGHGIAAKLESYGMRTMGDVALYSTLPQWEDELYRMFGVNAELLIDHAWGWEPCTMAEIKAYKPQVNSISSGQVLSEPYDFKKGRLIAKEMTDALVFDLVGKRLVTDRITLTVNYDSENLKRTDLKYDGPVVTDHYGRDVPKPAHGTVDLNGHTSSSEYIIKEVAKLYDSIVNPNLTVRRFNVTAQNVINESEAEPRQLDLFGDNAPTDGRERRRQEAVIAIRKRYGKNSILRGMNFEEGSTARDRNRQVGGHKA